MSPEAQGGARAFVRSLNILLKFARLYEFGHAKTTAQFDTTWKELRQALEDSGGSGVLLGASGHQILLDGVPMGSSAGEKSFAQLLTSSGIASIHFSPGVSQHQFARFVRAFPSGNAKPSALAEQLKTALGGDTSIKVNEIRYVAEDSSVAGIKVAAQLTAKALGAQGDKFREFFEDPNKMLQMILAAESARGGGGGGGAGGPGHGPGGPGPGFGLGGGGMGGSGGGTGPGGGVGGLGGGSGFGGGVGPALGKWKTASAMLHDKTGAHGSGGGAFTVEEEDVRQMLGLFASLGKARKDPDSRMDVPTFQSRLSAMPVRAQYTLQQALAGLGGPARHAQTDNPKFL